MPTDVETLMEMGFPRNRALLDHQDDPDIDEPFDIPKGHSLSETPAAESSDCTAAGGDENAEQKACSLKCEDCGKLLKAPEDAELHAARTKHTNFAESTEEIKPLTEEEKAAKLQELQEKMKARRAEKEEKEKKEQIEKEKARRIQSKGLSEARQKMQEAEIQKMVQDRRREKEEERLARQRVREQIEKDKRDRAAKFAKTSDTSTGPAATPAAKPTASTPTAAQAPKEYDQCRIQIRLTNGQALTNNFGAKEPLAAVRLYVQLHRTDGDVPFSFMTSFPRKVFSEADMDKPLNELGLVPSAVLMLTKTQ